MRDVDKRQDTAVRLVSNNSIPIPQQSKTTERRERLYHTKEQTHAQPGLEPWLKNSKGGNFQALLCAVCAKAPLSREQSSRRKLSFCCSQLLLSSNDETSYCLACSCVSSLDRSFHSLIASNLTSLGRFRGPHLPCGRGAYIRWMGPFPRFSAKENSDCKYQYEVVASRTLE